MDEMDALDDALSTVRGKWNKVQETIDDLECDLAAWRDWAGRMEAIVDFVRQHQCQCPACVKMRETILCKDWVACVDCVDGEECGNCYGHNCDKWGVCNHESCPLDVERPVVYNRAEHQNILKPDEQP